jgi:hypothetical protein
MAKNKGGREVRKPKQPKKAKSSTEPKPLALNVDRVTKKGK